MTARPEDEYPAAQDRLLSAHGVPAKSRFIELAWRGLRTHLIETGEGEPLIFVIGGGGFASSWAPLMARMRDRRLIAVDRPGFGLTQAVEHRTQTLREDAVEFLASVLDTLGIERATFVANSMGGLWTFWLAHDRPERVKSVIQVGCPALLLDTGAPMPIPLLGAPVLGRVLMALTPPSPRQVQRIHDTMNEGRAIREDPALAAAALAVERIPGFDSALRTLLRAALSVFGPRKELSFTAEQLANVHQPVQLIWGDDDPFGPVATGRRAAELLPNGRFAVVSGGHLPWLDAPDDVADHVRSFLG